MDAVAFESKSEKKARRKEKQEARERVIEKVSNCLKSLVYTFNMV